jgi:hypothetical protein
MDIINYNYNYNYKEKGANTTILLNYMYMSKLVGEYRKPV